MESLHKYIVTHLESGITVRQEIIHTLCPVIEEAADRLITSLKGNGKILVCGNGGSAADSQHIAAELVGRYLRNRIALPAIALTTDTSILTAVGNDFGFDDVFRRQVEALGQPGDVLLGISTSGQSTNVIRAMEQARQKEMSTIAMVGANNGPMQELADVVIAIPSKETPHIQEGHIAVAHILCGIVEDAFAK